MAAQTMMAARLWTKQTESCCLGVFCLGQNRNHDRAVRSSAAPFWSFHFGFAAALGHESAFANGEDGRAHNDQVP